MTELSDRDYYAARALTAFTLSELAIDPDIAAIHRRMADSYAELVELTGHPRPALRPVTE